MNLPKKLARFTVRHARPRTLPIFLRSRACVHAYRTFKFFHKHDSLRDSSTWQCFWKPFDGKSFLFVTRHHKNKTTTMAMLSATFFDNDDNTNDDNRHDDGIWIGIDLGTSNSACAVWDSTRGSPKWIRLKDIAPLESSSGKWGRLVPSIVQYTTNSISNNDNDNGNYNDKKDRNKDDLEHPQGHYESFVREIETEKKKENSPKNHCLVGAQVQQKHPHDDDGDDDNGIDDDKENNDMVIFQSVKRLLGKRYEELDPTFLQSLPYQVHPTNNNSETNDTVDVEIDNNEELELIFSQSSASSSKNGIFRTTPVRVLASILDAIRQSAQVYLDKYQMKKRLHVPGGILSNNDNEKLVHTENTDNARTPQQLLSFPKIRHVVIGIPAHFSQRHVQLIEKACRLGGFDGHIKTCLESTAAAMSYGLTLQETSDASNIIVIDMGGGTTDITIARKQSRAKTKQQQQLIKNDAKGSIETDKTTTAELDEVYDDEKSPSTEAEQGTTTPSTAYQVLVTMGNGQLGGDDIDRAILKYCLDSTTATTKFSTVDENRRTEQQQNYYSQWLLECRKAKEELCQMKHTTSDDSTSTSSSVTISLPFYIRKNNDNSINDIKDKKSNTTTSIDCELTLKKFEELLQPWLNQAETLIRSALIQFAKNNDNEIDDNKNDDDDDVTIVQVASKNISEVILVGGTTRIPMIRTMISTKIFPHIKELCISLHPMSSVAQGLAIQAAISSKSVPIHELQSALMLDCIPHAIGVLTTNRTSTTNKNNPENSNETNENTSSFIELIPKNTPLPARGYATFVLADPQQAGVTIHAVEHVGYSQYESISSKEKEFTFLLKRLTKKQIQAQMQQNQDEGKTFHRSIQVGMMVDIQGQFTVSIYDELDPEQVRKRQRFLQRKRKQANGNNDNENDEIVGELSYITDLVMAETEFSSDQIMLIGIFVGLLVLYLAVKIAFNEPNVIDGEGSRIF